MLAPAAMAQFKTFQEKTPRARAFRGAAALPRTNKAADEEIDRPIIIAANN
jgi:hypothetical protein